MTKKQAGLSFARRKTESDSDAVGFAGVLVSAYRLIRSLTEPVREWCPTIVGARLSGLFDLDEVQTRVCTDRRWLFGVWSGVSQPRFVHTLQSWLVGKSKLCFVMRASLHCPVAEFSILPKVRNDMARISGRERPCWRWKVLQEGGRRSRQWIEAFCFHLPRREKVVAYRSGLSTYQRNAGAETVGPAVGFLAPVECLAQDHTSLEADAKRERRGGRERRSGSTGTSFDRHSLLLGSLCKPGTGRKLSSLNPSLL